MGPALRVLSCVHPFSQVGELRLSLLEAHSKARLTSALPLHDPLILTMQGFGQHEPLLRLDLHCYSLSGLSYRQYVAGESKFVRTVTRVRRSLATGEVL